MIALKAIALVLFLFLPGWLAVSLMERRSGCETRGGKESHARGGAGKAESAGDEARVEASTASVLSGEERLFLAAATGTGIVSLCSLALALASAYRLWSLLVLVALLCLPMAALTRKRLSWPLRVGRGSYLVCLALVTVSLVLVSPPSRIVFGWSDVGVYANIAALIDRTGGTSFVDPLINRVDEDRRDLLYVRNEGPNRCFEAFQNKAFYITDMEKGIVVPQFYYLWPSLMAVFASFLGLEWIFWAVTLAAVLAFWGFFLLARRLLGWRWGLLTLVLFAVSPIFLYFSRYTTSEMMNLFLFLGACVCLVSYLEQEDRGCGSEAARLAVCAAFFLFLGFLCRIDFIIALAPIVLCYAGKRLLSGFTVSDRWFVGLTLTGGALSLLFGSIFTAPYFYEIMGAYESRLGWVVLTAGIAALIALVFAIIFGSRLEERIMRLLAKKRLGLRAASLSAPWVILAALFIFLYFVRPHGAETRGVYGGLNGIVGPLYKEETLVRWGWYFSFTGVALIYAGYALWLNVRRDFAAMIIGWIGLTFTLIYSWDFHNTPLHIMSMRRLVPVVLPLGAMVVLFLLKRFGEKGLRAPNRWLKSAWPCRFVIAGVFLYLFLYTVNVSIPIMGLQEGGNQLELCGDIARAVEEDAVVIMDRHMGDLYGAPLRCFYGVENAWLTDNAVLKSGEMKALLADLGYPHLPVSLLWRESMSGGVAAPEDGIVLQSRGEFAWREETLESTFTRRPRSRNRLFERIRLFAIEKT
ncbi:MAG: glycosyltransferase family 39 protein [Actinobacteria bacterium]|nr:glycosyltransferase family 39 protein [Actinomycetota bacterium]